MATALSDEVLWARVGNGALNAILVLGVVCAAAMLWVLFGQSGSGHVAAPPASQLPLQTLPAIEPVELQSIAPDEARAINAAVPFSTRPNPPARPFHLVGSPEDKARAVDCLAAAAWYEAGNDFVGEEAVAQVVLNRVRHPAFPKTICEVVFQGSTRSTGCQFTFTCDGALARKPSADAWERARAIATRAVEGQVFNPVGYSTHYHTDWVVPNWSSSLEKVVAVHTHLFFRWVGPWGTPAAFDRHALEVEPIIPALATISTAHAAADPLATVVAVEPPPVLDTLPHPIAGDPNTFLITVDPAAAGDYATMAALACGDRQKCRLLAWTDKVLTPASLPLKSEQIGALAFTFNRDRARGADRAQWNCAVTKRADPGQCLALQPTPPAVPDHVASAIGTPAATDKARKQSWFDANPPAQPGHGPGAEQHAAGAATPASRRPRAAAPGTIW